MSYIFEECLKRYLDVAQLQILQNTRIGIAGAGGLGSNIAMMLARSGVSKMTIIDSDHVDASNLNRQFYWPEHIGRKKVEALSELLLRLNHKMDLQLFYEHIDEENCGRFVQLCPIWAEALDKAETKAMFVHQALAAGCQVVAASGICGIGGSPMYKRRLGSLVITGDFHTDIKMENPMAPRVTQAAAMMADSILEILLKKDK